MERSKSVLIKNTIFAVYVLALVGLTAFGIWDVTNIITDYIQDNQFSLVKIKNSTTDRLRFIPSLRACMLGYPGFLNTNYDDVLLSRKDFVRMLNSTWHQEEVVWPQNVTKNEKYLISDLLVLSKIFLVNFMDILDPNLPDYDLEKFVDVDNSVANLMLTELISNPYSINTTKAAWITAKKVIFQEMYLQKIITEPTHFNGESPVLCLSLSLADDMLAGFDMSATYFFDFKYTENSDSKIQIQAKPESIEYFIGNEELSLKSGWHPNKNTTTFITVTIVNNGLIDSTLFPPCTSEFETTEDCLQDIKRRTMAEVCQCYQFSAAWRTGFLVNEDQTKLPFCTPEIYKKCWAKAANETNRRQKIAIDTNLCKPCLFKKNSFTFSTTTELPLIKDMSPWYPSLRVIFKCKDAYYLLFEERPQFSLSQLISQVGGDLGLYIGFSMISVLQLILFLYHAHERRKEAVGGTLQTGYGKWFRFYMQYVLRSVTDGDELMTTTNEKVTRKDLIDLKMEMKNEISQLNQKLDTIMSQCPPVSSSGKWISGFHQ